MELNNIKTKDISWGEAASALNENFGKIGTDVEKIKNATIKNKGYYASVADLTSAFPSAQIGDYAYVGSQAPYQTWHWTIEGWEKLNDDGGNINVDLNNYYPKHDIDGKLTELASEVSDVNKIIFGSIPTAEYDVVVGGNYDWKLAVDVDIKAGDEFTILVETDTVGGNMPLYFGFIENGTTAKKPYNNEYVYPNIEKTFVSTNDIKTLFVPYSLKPNKDGKLKISIKASDSLKDNLENIANDVVVLNESVKEISSAVFGMESTAEYNVVVGGNYDWKLAVDVDINIGDKFTIFVDTDTADYPFYFGCIEKDSSSKVLYDNQYIYPNIEKSFVSTKNIKTLFIPYTLSPSKDGKLKITVRLADSLKTQIEETNKRVEEVRGEINPMFGKTFYSIGDSHRWKWLNKLAEITGAKSGGDIFSAALDAYEKFYVSRTVAMAKYIVDLYKSGKPVDYIFMEYVHKFFVNNVGASKYYHYSGDITQAEPFLTQAYYEYAGRIFNGTAEASAFWNSNFNSIVGQFTPKSNSIIALKTGVKIQSPKFKLSGSVTNSGNFTIKFTDNVGKTYQMAIVIPSGLNINDALSIVNEIEFSDSGCKWDNLSAHSAITNASIKFTYTGDLNDSDSNIRLSFDFGTTGIIYDGDWSIATETSDWTRGFKSHDTSEWNNTGKWHDVYANVDAYIWIKAAVELLQIEIPTVKIFVWTLNTEAWNYANNTIEGKSVLYPDGTLNVQAIYDSEEHKRMVQNMEGWEKVAKYYHLGFIPISEMNSISPVNHKHYYQSDDVHPTQEGYDRVAEILAKNVY